MPELTAELAAELTPELIEVAFRGNRKEFFTWDGDTLPARGTPIIVEADRGEDLGRVHAVGEDARRRYLGCAHGCGHGAEPTDPSRRALRLATRRDVRQSESLQPMNDDARRRAAAKVRTAGLQMKISDAEWQWDRKKLTLYFTADKRVDFRNLVRDLASTFRTRIELKQIGVRDEARRLDGIGRCGRQYCSASWLPELRPVNLGVAKDQRLSLNPSQISGACGRLMCSLRYEHEFYVENRRRFPKEGKVFVTRAGEEKVVAVDLFRESVTLRSPEGTVRTLSLAEFRDETAAPSQQGPALVPEDEDAAPEEISPELMYTAEFAIPEPRLVILTESIERAGEETSDRPRRRRRGGRRRTGDEHGGEPAEPSGPDIPKS